MPAAVKRWILKDPYWKPGSGLQQTWTFPQNPASMTSIYPEKAVTSMTTTAGKVLLFGGNNQAKQWQFAGPILNKEHFDTLHHWVYERNNRLEIEDHFGRFISLYMMSLDAVPRTRVRRYYSHDYTVTAIITKYRYSAVRAVPDGGYYP